MKKLKVIGIIVGIMMVLGFFTNLFGGGTNNSKSQATTVPQRSKTTSQTSGLSQIPTAKATQKPTLTPKPTSTPKSTEIPTVSPAPTVSTTRITSGIATPIAKSKETPTTNTGKTNKQETMTIEIQTNQTGKYGVRRTMDPKTEFQRNIIQYFIPSGRYMVTNTSSKGAFQVTIYKNKINIVNGWEEFEPGEQKPIVLQPGASGEITIKDGEFIKISDGTYSLVLTQLPD